MKPTMMTFQRLEKKYLLNEAQYASLMKELKKFLVYDEFGPSTICNIYYDTVHYDLITQSLQKPPYKEKLRLRSYGIPNKDTMVYVEIKKKCAGVVNKRRVGLTLEEAQRYLQEGVIPPVQNQILSEINYFLEFYHPIPKVFLAYDREPYVCKQDSQLRFTFDRNIRRRYHDLSLTYGDQGETVFSQDAILMEIKVGDAYPLWLTKILSKYEIYPTSFSKYGTVFMEDVVKKERSMACSQAY